MKIYSTKTCLLSAMLAVGGALYSAGHGLYSEYNSRNNVQNEMVINNKNLSTDKLEKNNKIINHENNQVQIDMLLAIAFNLIAGGFTSLALLNKKQK